MLLDGYLKGQDKKNNKIIKKFDLLTLWNGNVYC